MAGSMITSNYIAALTKTAYIKGVSNDKPQISTLLPKIGKDVFRGKEMKYASQWDDGGNFGGDHSFIVDNIDEVTGSFTSGVKNGEWVMKQGYATGSFRIDQPEILGTETEEDAYMKAIPNQMAGCLSGLSRTLSILLYGGQYANLFRVNAADTTSDVITFATGTPVTFTVPSDVKVKLGLGSRLVFASVGSANAAVPSSPLVGSGAYAKVSAITKDSITVIPTADLNGVSIYTGDYVQLHGFRTAYNSTTTVGMEGLPDILPSLDDRTGSAWNTYIAQDFRGRDRSVAVERLAGQFVKAANSGATRLTDALTDLYNETTCYGMGLDNMIVLNPKKLIAINAEANAVKEFRKNVDGKKRVASFGLSDFSIALGEMTSGDVLADPACTEDVAYSFGRNDLKFYEVNNLGSIVAPVANGNIGKVNIESVGNQGIGDNPTAALNDRRLFQVSQNSKGRFSDVFVVSMNLFGNYKLENTASSGVANLA